MGAVRTSTKDRVSQFHSKLSYIQWNPLITDTLGTGECVLILIQSDSFMHISIELGP